MLGGVCMSLSSGGGGGGGVARVRLATCCRIPFRCGAMLFGYVSRARPRTRARTFRSLMYGTLLMLFMFKVSVCQRQRVNMRRHSMPPPATRCQNTNLAVTGACACRNARTHARMPTVHTQMQMRGLRQLGVARINSVCVMRVHSPHIKILNCISCGDRCDASVAGGIHNRR